MQEEIKVHYRTIKHFIHIMQEILRQERDHPRTVLEEAIVAIISHDTNSLDRIVCETQHLMQHLHDESDATDALTLNDDDTHDSATRLERERQEENKGYSDTERSRHDHAAIHRLVNTLTRMENFLKTELITAIEQ